MNSHRFVVPALLTTLVFTVGFVAMPATAQSDAQLRRQNEELRQDNENLRNQLREARQQIRDLEAQLEALRKQLAESPRTSAPSQPAPEPPVSIDESKPDASPRALFRAIQESYAENFADREIGSTDDRQRRAYMRDLERWTATVNRTYRGPIEWRIKILDARPLARGVELTLIAIDPVTGTELGNPFPARLENRLVIRRLERYEQDGQMNDLVLRGVLIPAVQVNLAREEVGAFNRPPFIGPFAEFLMGVEIQVLLPPGEADQQPSR